MTGDDLIQAGHVPGPKFREILNAVEDAQLEGRLPSRGAAWSSSAANFPSDLGRGLCVGNARIEVLPARPVDIN